MTTSFGSAPTAPNRTPLYVGIAVALVVAAVAAYLLFFKEDEKPSRTVVAIDVTVQLEPDEVRELLERRVTEQFEEDGGEVAVFSFGADAKEAEQRLAFTDRASCEGPTCDAKWARQTEQLLDLASAPSDLKDEATGSGIVEGLCSLPLQPGDTVLLVSDLTQRTTAVDLVTEKVSVDDAEQRVDEAQEAGLGCDTLEGTNILVLGFGSDGRSGAESQGIEAFWKELAERNGVASIEFQRFGA